MSAPVKQTCPDIDRVIKRIKMALKVATDGRRVFEKGTDEYAYCSDIEDELYGLEGELEDLRSANDSLRKWGDGLEDDLQKAAEEISDLEDQIETLKSQLA